MSIITGYNNTSSIVNQGGNTVDVIQAGARRITPTPINEFNKFVSVTGSGTAYTQANPGVWTTGISTAVPGDKICMLGGQYPFVANFHMLNSGYYNAGTWVQGIGYRMALGATMLNNKSSGKETATSNTAGSMIGNSW